jgi:hypothetical protein
MAARGRPQHGLDVGERRGIFATANDLPAAAQVAPASSSLP